MMTATYSPDDNKLRLYTVARLDEETYKRVHAAGFRWAPRQKLFVAPMWTPEREDLLVEMCGEMDDEDTSLVDRAAERAERFENYSEKRAADADRARKAVSAIADNIPFGQPILVGHHSERHARRDAERIENGMRRAVKMWRTSTYWTQRAAGALAHARYKELPNVRARRIKKIESDKRRIEKNIRESEARIRLWSDPMKLRRNGEPVTLAEAVVFLAGDSRILDNATPEEVCARGIAKHERYIEHARRWIEHYDNRLTYERAMLGESGYIEPPKAPTRAALPLLNYAGTVEYKNPYTGEVIKGEAHGMTSAEFAAINKDYKGTRTSADGTHRVRTALVGVAGKRALTVIWLTDKKQHPKPGAGAETHEQVQVERRVAEAREQIERQTAKRREVLQHNRSLTDQPKVSRPEPKPEAAEFEAIASTLKAGVQVVSAPQLFPTPPALAARMVAELGDLDGKRVLEPSAGTGNLAVAVLEAGGKEVLCYEINYQLAKTLRGYGFDAINGDFLEQDPCANQFDAVVMNPPFVNGADIKHIQHAFKFLKPGGRLVALCANGPRQRDQLGALVEAEGGTWEDLPDGSFSESGTNVRVALLTIDKAA
jgi:predicted RNA methylase